MSADKTMGVYDYGTPRVDHEGHIYYNTDILQESYNFNKLPESDWYDVLISGGSLGGLFTAHSLQQCGHSVSVYEKTEEGKMASRGGGIVPDLELFDYMEKNGIIEHRDNISIVVGQLDYLNKDGTVRKTCPYKIWSTDWGSVYRPLRNAVGFENYHMGTKVKQIESKDDSVVVTHTHGQDSGDIVAVAEGYDSPTRQRLLPGVSKQYAGYVAWRGLVSETELPDDLADYLVRRFVIYHGEDFQILTYPVPGPEGSTARGDRRINLVWYDNVPEGEPLQNILLDADNQQREGSLPPGKLRQEVRQKQNRIAEEVLPEPLTRYVKALDNMFIQCIFDIKIPQMVHGRVCLLGDGAFFVRPHMAAGTSKAAADGFELAKVLQEYDHLEAALDNWEKSQLRLGERLVNQARERGDRYMNKG